MRFSTIMKMQNPPALSQYHEDGVGDIYKVRAQLSREPVPEELFLDRVDLTVEAFAIGDVVPTLIAHGQRFKVTIEPIH